MRKVFLFILLAFFCIGSASAQKRKKKTPAKKVVVVEETEPTPEEELYEELLPSTAKIMFIDSVVVNKNDFLSQIPMPEEMGHISNNNGNIEYVNEFNDKKYISSVTNHGRRLFVSYKYGYKWEAPVQLKEIEEGFTNLDFPFLMNDGVTLYFAAEGEGTLGGSDIFRTTFDTEDSKFYEPVNMGLPFNSPANEYLLAISDFDNLGWLVSDRYQPEGKVCIYTFEPTAQRRTFDSEEDEEKIKPFANLLGINRTWKFGDRKAAINRKLDMMQRIGAKEKTEKVFFVVNDRLTITSLSQFSNPSDAEQYKQLEAMKKKYQQSMMLLETSRNSYAEAKGVKRTQIGENILKLEEETQNLELKIMKTEKQMRNNLNKE